MNVKQKQIQAKLAALKGKQAEGDHTTSETIKDLAHEKGREVAVGGKSHQRPPRRSGY